MKLKIWQTMAIMMTSIGLVSCGSSGGSTVTIKGTTSNLSTSSSVLHSPDARAATSGINPSSVRLKIYQVAVSTNTDCSSPTTIFSVSASAATYADFAGTPTLGTGAVADGTYPCVIIEMSDQVKFTPETATDNYCEADTEYTIDVCQDRGESSDDTSVLLDGSTTTCAAGANDERVAIYLSTISTTLPRDPESDPAEEGNPFKAPTSSTTEDGFLLDGAFVVSGASTGTFVADFTNRVGEDEDNQCGMESPNWGFQ